ncbi:restriction endonuclease subunit S [Nonlabens ulvanivorans]|uniref:restriction endonuclease subunit S n=1 Tax=Nonlabens ulvanivorans TaxID=906888 RepID=UPI0037C9E738
MVEVENKIRRYEKYKDSGISWLEQIPEHWELKRFKHIFKEKKITHNVELNCGSISFGKVVYKDDEKIPVSTKKSYQVLNKGEFLINPLNLNYDLKSLRIGLSDKDVVVSSGYIIVQNKTELSKDYFKWLLHIFDIAFMKTLGSGVRQTLSFTHIANSELVFPPLAEQTAIAQFLDDKTSKIEDAIAIKEQQISLLKERKQILIHKAVTRGLDDSVTLKDSGVEWIGEIPEHWEKKRLTNNIFIQEGPGIMAVDFKTEGIPLIRISGVKSETITLDGCNYLDPLKVRRKWNHFKLDQGDLVISGSASTELVSEVDEKTVDCILYTGLIRLKIKSNRLLKNYLKIFLGTKLFFTQIDLQKTGSTISHYGPSHLSNMFIILPPLSEQKEISAYIETASQKIETAIALKQQEIEKLKEYKSSLINGVVTGKVRVV